MEPTSLEGLCHAGDCLDILRQLPDKSIDHIITDPPYEREAHFGQVRVHRKAGTTTAMVSPSSPTTSPSPSLAQKSAQGTARSSGSPPQGGVEQAADGPDLSRQRAPGPFGRSSRHIHDERPCGEGSQLLHAEDTPEPTRNSYSGVKIEPISLSFGPMSKSIREEFSIEAARVCRGWLNVFCQVESASAWIETTGGGAKYKRTCIWVKPNPMPQISGDRPSQGYECFVCSWCSSGRSRWNGGGKSCVYTAPIPRGAKRLHSTQKPLSLMEEIILDFTNPGELILDPFAGSGTTLLAAHKNNRRYIGVELDPEYCRIANERVSGEKRNELSPKHQLRLFY